VIVDASLHHDGDRMTFLYGGARDVAVEPGLGGGRCVQLESRRVQRRADRATALRIWTIFGMPEARAHADRLSSGIERRFLSRPVEAGRARFTPAENTRERQLRGEPEEDDPGRGATRVTSA
jgi:hypothetical protein